MLHWKPARTLRIMALLFLKEEFFDEQSN